MKNNTYYIKLSFSYTDKNNIILDTQIDLGATSISAKPSEREIFKDFLNS